MLCGIHLCFKSLPLEICSCNPKLLVFKLLSRVDILRISCEIAIRQDHPVGTHNELMMICLCVDSERIALLHSCYASRKNDNMMASSNETFSVLLALWDGNPPVTGEFPSQRPVTRTFGVFFDLNLWKQLGKQSYRLWFETPSRSLWRHCNEETWFEFEFINIGNVDQNAHCIILFYAFYCISVYNPLEEYCISWWCHPIETFSTSLAICAGNSPVTGEFPAQRPVTRSYDVFFDLRLNKRLSKQSWSWCLRCHRAHYDVIVMFNQYQTFIGEHESYFAT